MSEETVIVVDHLVKKFGEATVLNDINLELQKGRIYGICQRAGLIKNLS